MCFDEASSASEDLMLVGGILQWNSTLRHDAGHILRTPDFRSKATSLLELPTSPHIPPLFVGGGIPSFRVMNGLIEVGPSSESL